MILVGLHGYLKTGLLGPLSTVNNNSCLSIPKIRYVLISIPLHFLSYLKWPHFSSIASNQIQSLLFSISTSTRCSSNLLLTKKIPCGERSIHHYTEREVLRLNIYSILARDTVSTSLIFLILTHSKPLC